MKIPKIMRDDSECGREHAFRLLEVIDQNKKVYVYKNLHNGLWSVRQGNRVVCHTDNICLGKVEFRVRQGGRSRVLRERKKNVHAFTIGYLASPEHVYSVTRDMIPVSYNPYRGDSFYDKNTERDVNGCEHVQMITTSYVPVQAFGINYKTSQKSLIQPCNFVEL